MNDLRTLVAKAARYMDKIKPDWWANVDPLRLNMMSPTLCICGQNDLNWLKVRRDGALHGNELSDPAGVPFWLEEIAKRMPAPVSEPEPVVMEGQHRLAALSQS